MGVYIKGMEMPKNCMLCPFCVEEADPANGEMCMVTGKLMPPCNRERLDNCPLVPVPPHRRLIEAEPIMKFITDGLNSGEFGYDQIKVLTEIQYAPTIIPAEEG